MDRNFKVWGYSFNETLLAGTTKEGTSRDIGSYEAAMKQLTDTISERLAYLDKELEEIENEKSTGDFWNKTGSN